MKLRQFFSFIMAGAVAAATLTACGDDDDDFPAPVIPETPALSNPAHVFVNGMPKKIGLLTINRAADGTVTSLTDDDESITFKKGGTYGTERFDVTMKVQDSRTGRNDAFYFQLNAQGFVKYAREVDADGDNKQFWFEYNSDGQLTSLKEIDGSDTEEYTLTYTAGDISTVTFRDSQRLDYAYTFGYTDAANTTPIDNKGCLTLFDEAYHVDIDDLEYAYYGGYLGKATKHLPLTAVEQYSGALPYAYTWTLNAQGLPTRFVSTYNNQPYGQTTLDIVW